MRRLGNNKKNAKAIYDEESTQIIQNEDGAYRQAKALTP